MDNIALRRVLLGQAQSGIAHSPNPIGTDIQDLASKLLRIPNRRSSQNFPSETVWKFGIGREATKVANRARRCPDRPSLAVKEKDARGGFIYFPNGFSLGTSVNKDKKEGPQPRRTRPFPRSAHPCGRGLLLSISTLRTEEADLR